MKWQVRLSKRAVRNYQKLPQQIQERFKALALELRSTGPVQRQWPHYGKIQGMEKCYHCHIKPGRPTYVAVWKVIGAHYLEVTYVGTHEGADYQRLC
jgi:mRNA-degrading endonuclease RelE of RelBE toxin-antitoxin system